jgi:hypothetical protein
MKSQEELRLFVTKRLKNGYPQGELINDLLGEGYRSEEIQKAIYDPPEDKELKKEAQPPANYPFWFVLTITSGITGLSIVSVSLFRNSMIGYILIAVGIIGLFVKFIIPLIMENQKKK